MFKTVIGRGIWKGMGCPVDRKLFPGEFPKELAWVSGLRYPGHVDEGLYLLGSRFLKSLAAGGRIVGSDW